MQRSTVRRALLPLALLLAASAAISAPAPVYRERPSLEAAHRALPERLRDMIESFHNSLPEMIEDAKRNLRLARTQKQKDIHLSGIEAWKAEFYRHPIELLEYQRQQSPYQSREDQKKIETALKFYCLLYQEAKKKGLFTESPNKQSLN